MTERLPDFTLLMPCLDEARTLPGCLEAAFACVERLGLDAEVLVADNGSSDGSGDLARARGARVVEVPEKGYGAALLGGIEAARGRWVMMADCDGSVDWGALDLFVHEVRAGADLVMGCRLPAGGGTLHAGAMPWMHQHVGNPGISFLGWWLFGARVTDQNCGVRMFRRDRIQALDLRTTGMEFASEMLIKATLFGLDIREVPIHLYPDGRDRAPHARTFVDGWRHLRFMLLMSPLWLFLLPGGLLMAGGAALGAHLAAGGTPPWLFAGDALAAASLSVLLGFQILSFGLMSRTFAVAEGLLPRQQTLDRLYPVVTLEVGVVAGFLLVAAGLVGLLLRGAPGVDSDLARVAALTLSVLGAQVVFTSFMLSVLGLRRR